MAETAVVSALFVQKEEENMKKKILIIDGSNLLFQMFFGMPARIYNEQGIGIWGVIGFVGALLKIIRQTKPTHLAVLFDGESENERTLIDSDYKANRVDYSQVAEEENPFSQLPYIYEALKYMGIAHAETTDCETDDWIAGYVKLYGAENEMVISSFDSDFFQLISENVTILRYRGENSILCTPQYLWEKFEITPSQYAEFKSLTGDKADNIPGAPKVGAKTASALLKEYGTLERLIRDVETIKKQSVKVSISEHTERLRQNLKLIKLEGNTSVPFALEEMQFADSGITTTEVLRGIGLKS